jgi:hypothetical protein
MKYLLSTEQSLDFCVLRSNIFLIGSLCVLVHGYVRFFWICFLNWISGFLLGILFSSGICLLS